LALKELAKFHACGLAYRMSLKEEIEEKYPFMEDDLYTSSMAKELLAKYLDSYLHFLSHLPGLKSHVHRLRKISSNVFEVIFFFKTFSSLTVITITVPLRPGEAFYPWVSLNCTSNDDFLS